MLGELFLFSARVTYRLGSLAYRTAISTYSSLVLAISSGNPRAVSWEDATLEARVSIFIVTTGVPVKYVINT